MHCIKDNLLVLNIINAGRWKLSVFQKYITILLMIPAIMLTVLGPIWDHHFADKLPWHSHVSLDGSPILEHSHLSYLHTHDENLGHNSANITSKDFLGFSVFLLLALTFMVFITYFFCNINSKMLPPKSLKLLPQLPPPKSTNFSF